jgi:type IV secretion system protein VirB1
MLPGIEMAACTDLAVPSEVMTHVARVESSFNPYAIGVVGGRLVRQPKNLSEAVSTAQMLEDKGYNFSIGISQVNRYNLDKYGLESYEKAFQVCPNVVAGSRILAECYGRAKSDWGKAFSCYYSGNFVTGFRHGYVQKVYASIAGTSGVSAASAIPLAGGGQSSTPQRATPGATRAAAIATTDAAISTLAARRGGLDTPMQTTNSAAAQLLEQASPLAEAPASGLSDQQRTDLWEGVSRQTPATVAPLADAPVMLGESSPVPRLPVRPAVQTQLPASATEHRDSALVF